MQRTHHSERPAGVGTSRGSSSRRLPAFVPRSFNGAGERLAFLCVSPVDSNSILLLCTLKRNYCNSLGAQTFSHLEKHDRDAATRHQRFATSRRVARGNGGHPLLL